MERQEVFTGLPFRSLVKKKETYKIKLKIKKTDYGWVPRWGLITEKTIKQFYKTKKTKFTMKDKSVVHLCNVSELVDMINSNLFSWVTDNPGTFQVENLLKKIVNLL